jgi:ADP-heptose:LPS heptosyltransferase
VRPSSYQKQWEALREGSGDPAELERLATRVALSFLDHYYYNDRFDADYIRLLCEIATLPEDEDLRSVGSRALFGIVIERLCDDLEEMQADAYNRTMSLVLSYARKAPGGEKLDSLLGTFGLPTAQSLFDRAERVREDSYKPRVWESTPRRVFVLSRVTIGADVAITSVILERLGRLFPEAELVLLGGGKLRELFGARSGLRIHELGYPRRGGLLSRMHAWSEVLEAAGESDDEVFVVDTDSRLSQLGVLPVVPLERYFFFNSRLNTRETARMSMSELANHWFDSVFGGGEFCYPRLWLEGEAPARAARFVEAVRNAGCKRLLAVSLGTGGNERKSLGEAFDRQLLRALLEGEDTLVLLDKGSGETELGQSRRLLAAAEAAGQEVADVTFDNLDDAVMPRGLVTVENSIGQIASLIAGCDAYIGYDSACKHLAAALGVKAHTVFAGTNLPRFVWRWRGCGPLPPRVIHVDTLTHPHALDPGQVVARILAWLSSPEQNDA